MAIKLRKITMTESEKLHDMQVEAFRELLEKYEDFETSPGAETLERVKRRFRFDTVEHYWILAAAKRVGCIRIQQKERNICRLSQMFILPEFQGQGYAQQAIALAEGLYPHAEKWELDTIKQEEKLCHLYEKMGYRQTGETHHIKPGMDLVDYVKP